MPSTGAPHLQRDQVMSNEAEIVAVLISKKYFHGSVAATEAFNTSFLEPKPIQKALFLYNIISENDLKNSSFPR